MGLSPTLARRMADALDTNLPRLLVRISVLQVARARGSLFSLTVCGYTVFMPAGGLCRHKRVIGLTRVLAVNWS